MKVKYIVGVFKEMELVEPIGSPIEIDSSLMNGIANVVIRWLKDGNYRALKDKEYFAYDIAKIHKIS